MPEFNFTEQRQGHEGPEGIASMTKPAVSHEERAARRKEMAEFVKQHGGDRKALEAAAKKFGVVAATVIRSCASHGVRVRAYKGPGEKRTVSGNLPVNPRTVQIIAELIRGDRSQSEIARKYGVSRQQVGVVKQKVEAAGVLPKAK